MGYLLRETRRYLQDFSGSDIIFKLKSSTQVIFANPNAWGASQQTVLQQAAVDAGLVLEVGLVSFVEEGEAAATYCVSKQPTFAANLQVSFL